MKKLITRRIFIILAAFGAALSILSIPFRFVSNRRMNRKLAGKSDAYTSSNIKKKDHEKHTVFLVKNGTPEENMKVLINQIGGISKYIDQDDIVVIKPNAQWDHQGMTNTNAIKEFIKSILDIPNFTGEVIIAENHHVQADNSRGWTTKNPNGDYNYNQLIEYFNNKGYKNVTKYHWHDAGPNPNPREGDACCGRLVNGPWEGDGYVWMKDMVYVSPENRKCIMTYPIFTSKYSGITIDLKNGAWKNGRYIEPKVKLINFSAMNHHGSYVGVTASIKNIMGIVDMTCGYQGITPKGYYNTHFIGSENVAFRQGTRVMFSFYRRNITSLGRLSKYLVETFGNFNFQYTGGALGYWMANVKKPSLNIITAEWIGWGGRSDPTKSSRAKTILASTNPVTLDYCAIKHVLYEATKAAGEKAIYYLKYNNPEYLPLKYFLLECQKYMGGALDDQSYSLHTVDLASSKNKSVFKRL